MMKKYHRDVLDNLQEQAAQKSEEGKSHIIVTPEQLDVLLRVIDDLDYEVVYLKSELGVQ